MRKDIHPKYGPVTVKCACGSTVETNSTSDELSVEVCSKCHPFFTGTQRFVDTGGRIGKFQRRLEQSQAQ